MTAVPDEKVVDLPRGPGRPPGLGKPPGSGRQRGTRNRRTLEIEALLRPSVPAARRRLRAIIADPKTDTETALTAIRILFDRVYGKPRERQEISGPDGAPISQRVDDGGPSAEEVARCAVGILERAKAGTP